MKKLALFLMVATALSFAGCHEAEEDKTKPGVEMDESIAPDTVVVDSISDGYKETLRSCGGTFDTRGIRHNSAAVYNFKHNGHRYIMFTVISGIAPGTLSMSIVHDPDCPCQEVKGPGFGVRSNNEQASGPQITL